jgi:LuxR family maltose regulon positive regulatory protein
VPEPWMDRLRRIVAATANRPTTGTRELVEQLTDRERDILRFLPSRLTVREIAQELYVSVNTLKFHLKVIYRKLGVTSRAAAAEKARQLTR